MIGGERITAGVAAAVVVLGCGDGSGPAVRARPFLMGFSAIPPRADSAIVVPAINYWAQRADAAIIHASPPWAALLGGVSPAAAVDTVQAPLASYFRAKGLALVFTVDATDGLNRAAIQARYITRQVGLLDRRTRAGSSSSRSITWISPA